MLFHQVTMKAFGNNFDMPSFAPMVVEPQVLLGVVEEDYRYGNWVMKRWSSGQTENVQVGVRKECEEVVQQST